MENQVLDLAGPGIGNYEDVEKVLPKNYKSLLTPKETQIALNAIKKYIEDNMAKELNLIMVSVPLIVDRDSGGKFLNIEASRRIGSDWLLEMQGRFLFDTSPSDPAFAVSRDDYLELFLTYNF